MEQAIFNYVNVLNFSVSKTWLKKMIASHSDYPSLLSVSDTLERLGLQHQILRIAPEDLEHFSTPYLLHLNRSGGEMLLITNENDLKSKNSDLEFWDGVILKIYANDVIQDEESRKQLSEESFLRVVITSLLVSIGLLLILSFVQTQVWFHALLLLTALGGATIGYILIAKDLGINYKAVEAFCNTGTRANCDRILTSDGARLLGPISLSDVTLSYFIFQLVIIGILSPLIENSETYLLALAIASSLTVPVVLYSIYYQSVNAKIWCKLCLIVDGILVIQFILFANLYVQNLIQPYAVELISFLLLGSLFVIIAALTMLAKSLLEKTNQAVQAEIKANRIKNSPDLFSHQLFQSRRVDITPFEHEIVLGDKNAPIKIVMAANLYCHPCKIGFGKLKQLLAVLNEKVNLFIRLVSNGRGNGQQFSASDYLLAYWLHHIHGDDKEDIKTKQLFQDWYEKMDFASFKTLYSVNSIIEVSSVEYLEYRHSDWIVEEQISGTPTWFLNGYQLPENYSIEDLMAIVPGLSETVNERKFIHE